VARFFFEYFYKGVFKAAYFITQDVQLAEDVVQETFLKAISKLRQLDDEAKINAWLIKIAMNEARSLMRKNRRFPVSPKADMIYGQASKYLPEEMIVQKEDFNTGDRKKITSPSPSLISLGNLVTGMASTLKTPSLKKC